MEVRRTVLQGAAALGVTALLSSCVLYFLLTRLGDARGAGWAARFGTVALVVTVTAVTTLVIAAPPDPRQDPTDDIRSA